MVLLIRFELMTSPLPRECSTARAIRAESPPKWACVWSGKRDSNSRHSPWQGDALPTELFPHRTIYSKFSCAKVSAVVCLRITSFRTFNSKIASWRVCFCFFKLATTALKPARSSAVNTPVSTVSPYP